MVMETMLLTISALTLVVSLLVVLSVRGQPSSLDLGAQRLKTQWVSLSETVARRLKAGEGSRLRWKEVEFATTATLVRVSRSRHLVAYIALELEPDRSDDGPLADAPGADQWKSATLSLVEIRSRWLVVFPLIMNHSPTSWIAAHPVLDRIVVSME